MSRLGATLGLVWAGLAGGISFVEAPAKFLAPSLTRAVALDVGRHVFAASHLVQLGLAAALVLLARQVPRLAVAALAVQLLVVMPVLDANAATVVAGGTPPGGPFHLFYVLLELVKVGGLVAFAWSGLDSRADARLAGVR